jgi:hypothetical protein
MLYKIFSYLRRKCNRNQVIKPEIKPTDFLIYCEIGNLDNLIDIMKSFHIEKSIIFNGIEISINKGFDNITLFLLDFVKDDKTLLNTSLKLSCIKNNYAISERLVLYGADITIGLRNSKSPNITKMLYRYEHGGELLN